MADVSELNIADALETARDAALDRLADGFQSEAVGGSYSLTEMVNHLADTIGSGLSALGDSLVKAAMVLAEAIGHRKESTP